MGIITSEEFAEELAKQIAAQIAVEQIGRFTGEEVVALHKDALEECAGKSGWDVLECTVNRLHGIYETAKEEGVERALEKW